MLFLFKPGGVLERTAEHKGYTYQCLRARWYDTRYTQTPPFFVDDALVSIWDVEETWAFLHANDDTEFMERWINDFCKNQVLVFAPILCDLIMHNILCHILK